MAKRTRVTTLLNPREMRDFNRAKKFVEQYSGKVSRAEVLRYLVRNWVIQNA